MRTNAKWRENPLTEKAWSTALAKIPQTVAAAADIAAAANQERNSVEDDVSTGTGPGKVPRPRVYGL